MLLKLTLTPNRSTPAIYTRMVLYRRFGDRVEAYAAKERDGQVTVEPLAWRNIAASDVEPEFQRDWVAHVAYQRALARE